MADLGTAASDAEKPGKIVESKKYSYKTNTYVI
jgi:hypothetical protein